DHGARADHSAGADGDALQDRRPRADPDVVADLHRRGALHAFEGVVVGVGDADIPADGAALPDPHGAHRADLGAPVQPAEGADFDSRLGGVQEQPHVPAELHALAEHDAATAARRGDPDPPEDLQPLPADDDATAAE